MYHEPEGSQEARSVCYILCLAVPETQPDPGRSFDRRVSLDVLRGESLAVTTVGDRDGHSAYALTMGGCSCDVLVGGHRMAGRPELVLQGLGKLLEKVSEVALLKHWFTRPLSEVTVECREQRPMTLGQFNRLYPKLEEDVRYIVRKGSKGQRVTGSEG